MKYRFLTDNCGRKCLQIWDDEWVNFSPINGGAYKYQYPQFLYFTEEELYDMFYIESDLPDPTFTFSIGPELNDEI